MSFAPKYCSVKPFAAERALIECLHCGERGRYARHMICRPFQNRPTHHKKYFAAETKRPLSVPSLSPAFRACSIVMPEYVIQLGSLRMAVM